MSLRMLYVIDSLAPGGAETSLAELAPDLVRGGIDLHVLPLGSRRDLADRLTDAGAIVHLGPRHVGRRANLNAVLQTARRVRPELVHTTLYEADVAGRTAARLLGLPSSTSIVSDSYSAAHYAHHNTAKLHAARALDAATARFAGRFHAISQAIAETVPPRIGVPLAKVEVVPRGRDPLAYPFRTEEAFRAARADLGLDADAPVVLAIGRLDPEKGLRHLFDALPAVAAAHPGLVTLVAGKEGRAADALREQAAASGLDIRFLGHRSDVTRLLTAADAFCFPSEREGFGGVLIEALAVGCPIVASDIPTSREVLGDDVGRVGTLTPTGDPASLGRALVGALARSEAVGALERAGRERFERLYSVGGVAERMIAFFDMAATPRSLARGAR